jgi:serine/threonine protein kinase
LFGLSGIHKIHIVHHDFHTGNILLDHHDATVQPTILISDLGLSGEIGNVDETKLYGVIPYMAPEVLRGNSFTQASDIYSFGMIMYFIATGRQPFAGCEHDQNLIIDICKGDRPNINKPEAPQCYIDLMMRCLDSNPNNRPNTSELYEILYLFIKTKMALLYNYNEADMRQYLIERDISKQFEEAEAYREKTLKNNESNVKDMKSSKSTNPQTTQANNNYTSRLIECFTNNFKSEDFSDCAIIDENP